jgi:hypothetical protein
MASVRMTQDLRRTILKNAEEAFTLANPSPQVSNELRNTLARAVLNAPVQSLLKQLTDIQLKSFNVNSPERRQVSAIDIHYDNTRLKRNMWVTITLNAPITIYSGRTYSNPDVYVSDLLVQDQSALTNSLNAFDSLSNEYETKLRAYRNKIESLLDNITSVRQFLDAWPAGEQFVPREAIQRMQEKITRKQRAQKIIEKVDFDDSEVNEVVLTAKVMGL